MSKNKPKTNEVIKKKTKKKTGINLQAGLFVLTIGLALVLTILFYPSNNQKLLITNEDVCFRKEVSDPIDTIITQPLFEYKTTEYLLLHVDSVFNDFKFDQLEDDVPTEILMLSGKIAEPLYSESRNLNTQKKVLETHLNTIETNPNSTTTDSINTAISCVFHYISLYKGFIIKVKETISKRKDLETFIVYFNYYKGFSMITSYINFKTRIGKSISPLIDSKIITLNTNRVLNNIVTYKTSDYKLIFDKIVEKVQMKKKTENSILTKESYYYKLNYNTLNEYLNDNLILILLLLFKFNDKGEVVDYESFFLKKMDKVKEEHEKDYIKLNASLRTDIKDLMDALVEDSMNENGQSNSDAINLILDNIIHFCDKHIIDTDLFNKG